MICTFATNLRDFLSPFIWLFLIASYASLLGQSQDSTEVFGLVARCQVDLKSGEISTLRERLDSLEIIQETLARLDWRVSALCVMTEMYTSLGNLPEAEAFSAMGLNTIHRARGNIPDTLVDLVYFLEAAIHSEKVQWDSFATYMDSSFQILDSLPTPDPIREARNAISMSFMTYNQGNLSQTIEWELIKCFQLND